MRPDWLVVAACAIGVVGLVWLAPLMFDQLVFFADRDQTQQAEDSRRAMLPASALVLASALGLLVRRLRWHSLVVALPVLVAVPLAWMLPGPAYQLLAYGILAPAALGALLGAAVPGARSVPVAIAVAGIGLIALMGIVATPFIALLALVAAAVWWRLRKVRENLIEEGPPQASPPA
ncbi:MAG TPA: hypothetical protein VF364_01445 [Candidatus Limnocylindria bacterium]